MKLPKIFFLAVVLAFGPIAQAADQDFIRTHIIYYGGPTFQASDATDLAEFDVLTFDRRRHGQINGDTWGAIKALNPDAKIYLYQVGPETTDQHETYSAEALNSISRAHDSRQHPMGALESDNPQLYYTSSSDNRVSNVGFPIYQLMNFGDPRFHEYWAEATLEDIARKSWRADGVFVDNMLASGIFAYSKSEIAPLLDSWDQDMNAYTAAVTERLREEDQLLFPNRGNTRFESGFQAWLALDSARDQPEILLEEGAFAVSYGPADVQFYNQTEWRRQVEIVGRIENSDIAMITSTDLHVGESGTDNYGASVGWRDVLWYGLASYQLARRTDRNNALFMFHPKQESGSRPGELWRDEYSIIDLGDPVGEFVALSGGLSGLYMREFQRGFVYVNASPDPKGPFSLPEAGIELTPANMGSDLAGQASISSVPVISGHRGKFFVKAVISGEAPGTPPNAKATLQ